MEVMEAIRSRRAVRDYTEKPVPRDVIESLLEAAVLAPSAMNQRPWAFAVLCGRERLQDYSNRAKAVLVSAAAHDARWADKLAFINRPEFDFFYNANTLIVIYAKPGGLNPAEDCCLAAENLMLAATSLGLATCPIGLARPWLDLPETKRELGVPVAYSAVMPLIAGYPAGDTPAVPRNPVEIVTWLD